MPVMILSLSMNLGLSFVTPSMGLFPFRFLITTFSILIMIVFSYLGNKTALCRFLIRQYPENPRMLWTALVTKHNSPFSILVLVSLSSGLGSHFGYVRPPPYPPTHNNTKKKQQLSRLGPNSKELKETLQVSVRRSEQSNLLYKTLTPPSCFYTYFPGGAQNPIVKTPAHRTRGEYYTNQTPPSDTPPPPPGRNNTLTIRPLWEVPKTRLNRQFFFSNTAGSFWPSTK